MKVCRMCGDTICTKDGDNLCRICHDVINRPKSRVSYKRRTKREQILRSLGLVKVTGQLGGVYWE